MRVKKASGRREASEEKGKRRESKTDESLKEQEGVRAEREREREREKECVCVCLTSVCMFWY